MLTTPTVVIKHFPQDYISTTMMISAVPDWVLQIQPQQDFAGF